MVHIRNHKIVLNDLRAIDSAKVSAPNQPETCTNFSMIGIDFCRCLTQPVAGLTILALTAIALPLPSIAQMPVLQNPTPRTGDFRQVLPEAAYTLGAGDRVRMDIFNIPEYTGEYQVLVDGKLNLPIIGSVSVQGLTLQDASELISRRYAPFVRRPIVTLNLLSTRPLRVAVSGEVSRPGSYTLSLTGGAASQTGTQSIQFPTVTQALQVAGGATQSADVRQVVVRRQLGNREQVIDINLWNLFQTGDITQDISLRDGDSIFIPTVTAANPVESRQLASATFAAPPNQPLKIAVVGEVYRPGPYTVTPDNPTTPTTTTETSVATTGNAKLPTVTRAIQLAGGIKPFADIRQVQVRRLTKNSSEQVIDVNLWQLLQAGDLTQDVLLQEGDTIVVPTATNLTAAEESQIATASFSPDKIKVYVVGEVKRNQDSPFVEVPPNTPLNQALLAAGGFNTRAKKGSVELIRLNANGTVSKRIVPVDFAQGINEQTNPAMRNNDVIVVRRSGLASFSDTLSTVLNPVGGIFSFFNFFRIFQGD